MAHRSRTFTTVSGDEIRIEISNTPALGTRVYLTPARLWRTEVSLSRADVQAIGAFLGEEPALWDDRPRWALRSPGFGE